MTKLFHPAGTLADGPDPVRIAPIEAGWVYSGLRVMHADPGTPRRVVTGSTEMAVLPLSGSARVDVEGSSWFLEGRSGVFAGISDFAYIPMDSEFVLTSPTGGEFALCIAEATRRRQPAYVASSDVSVEVRGAGQATRQINNFLNPDVDLPDKLLAVEVITPAGNWSSYPPHKHDETSEHEVELEEIYYFRIDGVNGFGFHSTYTLDGEIDETVTVRDGDVFLVPRGYHGPCVAPPGYHMYYLNVMAGPGEGRVWKFCDDPAHGWVRETWEAMDLDPRLPLTSASR